MKSFKTFITEGGRSRGESLEHSIVTAINGKEKKQKKISLGVGKKIVKAAKLSGTGEVVGDGGFEVTSEWKDNWPGKVPSSTKTPKTDIIIGKKRISLKAGGKVQLMSGGKNESEATFRSAIQRTTSLDMGDIMEKIEKSILELSPAKLAAGQIEAEKKKGKDKVLMKATRNHTKLQKMLRDEFANNEQFAFQFAKEAMVGQAKFGKKSLASCTHILSASFEGDDVHLIPITNKAYITKIANSVRVVVRFKSASQKKTIKGVKTKTGKYRYWSVVSLIADKIVEEFELAGDYLTEGIITNIIKKIKDWVANLWTNKILPWLKETANNIIGFLGLTPDVKFNNEINWKP
jgi:hypothetical protein